MLQNYVRARIDRISDRSTDLQKTHKQTSNCGGNLACKETSERLTDTTLCRCLDKRKTGRLTQRDSYAGGNRRMQAARQMMECTKISGNSREQAHRN